MCNATFFTSRLAAASLLAAASRLQRTHSTHRFILVCSSPLPDSEMILSISWGIKLT
jgi:hypothetical protein